MNKGMVAWVKLGLAELRRRGRAREPFQGSRKGEGWVVVATAAFAVAFALGIGSADAGPTTTAAAPTQAPPAGAVPPRANIDWAKMSRTERKDYMKNVILPKAKEMFTSFDPK